MMPLLKIRYLLSAALLVTLASPVAAFAQTSAPLSGLFACEGVVDKDAQLSCFLAETAKLRAPEILRPVPTVEEIPEILAEVPVVQDKPAPVFNEAFAESEKARKAPKKRTSPIRSAEAFGGKGYMRFTLENGEVWEQIEAGRVRLGKGSPDVLVIKKASFGSFLGRVNDKRPSFRVRQVK